MASPQATDFPGLLPPPPGVTPNLDNPYSISNRLIIVSIICLILAGLFVAARCASKTVSRSWGWDDYAEITGLVFSIALAIVSVIPSQQYGVGRHMWDVRKEWLIPFLKYTYAETIIYVIGLYFVKLSLLILLFRVFGVNKYFRWANYATIAFWTLYSVTDTLVIIFQCTPVHKAWAPLVDGHCLNLLELGVSSGYINIATDVMILLLPIPMVLTLQLPTKIRLAVMAIFATGVFVIGTTIVRQIQVVKTVGGTDSTYFSCNSLMWLNIEVNVSIICGCMPTLKPLLRHTIWRQGSNKTPGYNFNHKSNSNPKNSDPSKSNGDSLMDASYIELGPPGTNRDVHIIADDTFTKSSSLDQENGRIMKTNTFGQVVHYNGHEQES